MVRNYKRKTEDRWSKEDLLEALICIKEAKLKINDAARQYGISRATLYRQYQKFILAGGKCDVNQFRTCGGNPILTKVEEDVLEKTIRDLREQGFTVTSSDIKRICFEYCDSNGIPNQFNQEKRMASDDWYYGFLKRHPDVRIPKPGGGSGKNPITGSPSQGSNSGGAGDIDGMLLTTTILSSADKMSKTKKSKSSPGKKVLKQDKSAPTRSPVHVIPTLTPNASKVTADKRDKRSQQDAAPILIPSEALPSGHLKKPLKRLSGKSGGKSRSRKATSSAALQTIPMEDEYVKAEVDNDTEQEEDGEDQMEQDEGDQNEEDDEEVEEAEDEEMEEDVEEEDAEEEETEEQDEDDDEEEEESEHEEEQETKDDQTADSGEDQEQSESEEEEEDQEDNNAGEGSDTENQEDDDNEDVEEEEVEDDANEDDDDGESNDSNVKVEESDDDNEFSLEQILDETF